MLRNLGSQWNFQSVKYLTFMFDWINCWWDKIVEYVVSGFLFLLPLIVKWNGHF